MCVSETQATNQYYDQKTHTKTIESSEFMGNYAGHLRVDVDLLCGYYHSNSRKIPFNGVSWQATDNNSVLGSIYFSRFQVEEMPQGLELRQYRPS